MFQDLRASGLTALNQTVGHVYGPGDPFEATVRDIARTHQRIRTNASRLRLIQAASEIRDCRREGKAGIILGFQNTLMLGAQADRVGLFADLGVKVIQLTYNDRNPVGDGGLVPENRGLTAFGREVVAELNRTRTLVDLSHSGENTCLDAIASSKVPITISHSGCRALCDRPRNKTDRELRALADRGGVLGIYFMPYLKDDSRPRAEDVVHHIEHAWNVCGEDHVALGTDGTACRIKDLEGMRRAISEDVARRKAAGVSAPGEIAGVLPLVEDLTGPGQFHRLSDLLKARGHASARIEKLLGSNLLRLYADIWGG
jgi:membrane dipeptidase